MITYDRLKKDVDALGTKMLAMGLGGKRIAVMPGDLEWFVTYLATVNGVGVVVPVDKEFDAAMVRNVLDTASATRYFTQAASLKRSRSLQVSKIR